MFFLQLSGSPGSGKSTLALAVAKIIDVVIIDHDVTKSALMQEGVDEKILGRAAYAVDYAYVNYYLSQGRNVIMDSPCFYDMQLERSIAAAKNNGAVYKYVECYLSDPHEINKRLASRERKPSQWESVDPINFAWVDDAKKPERDYIVVDTSKPIDTYLQRVIDYLHTEIGKD